MEMTADQMFAGGHCAPRGTYLNTSTGVVHRLSRPTTLPQGGPFRLVAPTANLGLAEPVALAVAAGPRSEYRWPHDVEEPVREPDLKWFELLAAYRVARLNSWW
jgi:hypothetical protein